MRRALFFLTVVGCIVPQELEVTLQRTEDTIAQAHRLYAPLCTPQAIARAETGLDFARIELHEGTLQRGRAPRPSLRRRDVRLRSPPCAEVPTATKTPSLTSWIDARMSRKDLDGDRDEDGCKDF